MPEVSRRKKKKKDSLDRSYLVLAPELVDRLSWDQSRKDRKERRRQRERKREGEREGRWISSSTGSINHQGESENPDSWGPDELEEKEEKKREEECGRRSWQIDQSVATMKSSVLFLLEASSRLHPAYHGAPRSFRSFPVSRESTEVFRTIVFKNHSVD